MLNKKIIVAITAMALLAAGTAWAKVPQAEAEKLKGELTPFGAERAGNADGTIPAWDGGIKGVPAGIDYKPGDIHPDPFKDDKVLFSITGQNVAQHEAKLSKGIIALLNKYPDARLDIYPTHRTASAPQRIYDNNMKTATNCELTADGLGVEHNGALGGIPFPIPKKAEEVMFNHLLRWKGLGLNGINQQFNVQGDGKRAVGGGGQLYEVYPWYDPKATADSFGGNYFQLMMLYKYPARRNGEIALVLDPLNQSKDPRKAWQYLPGQRRVRRAPSISFDTPNPAVSGLGNYDDVFMFNGSLERYDWKIVGKKELYIPYNTYAFDLASIEEVATPHFPNEKLRWELHRVWVIEATLKDGKRHAYAKREFYLDEDTWNGVLADNYDGRGNLWRITMQPSKNAYEVPATLTRNYLNFDLTRDDWANTIHVNGLDKMHNYTTAKDDTYFSPENVRRLGRR